MQARHQPYIKNIEAVLTRLAQSQRPSGATQRDKVRVLDREFTTVCQKNLERCKGLRVKVLLDRFNRHRLMCSTGYRFWQCD